MAGGDLARLGLGTVQFGLDYGISNREGRTPPTEVRRILAHAHEVGIRVLDTAALYGDSEAVLGDCMPKGASFRIVTKTPSFSEGVDEAVLRACFHRSLQRLRVERVHGLLVHHGGDLLQPDGERLWAGLRRLREEGCVARVGVSVYGEGARVLERFPMELMQLPLNLLDQRAEESGLLNRSDSVAFHVRSVFLQGLLLMGDGGVPDYFAPIRDRFQAMASMAARYGVSRLALALWYALRRTGVETVLVGVTTLRELEEIVKAVESLPQGEPEEGWSPLAVDDPRWVEPSRWPGMRWTPSSRQFQPHAKL